jgi:hypothetical protein
MPRLTILIAFTLLLAPACDSPGHSRTGTRGEASSPNLPPTKRDAADPARSPEIEPGVARPAPRQPKVPGSAPDGSSIDAPREPGSGVVGDPKAAPRPPSDR